MKPTVMLTAIAALLAACGGNPAPASPDMRSNTGGATADAVSAAAATIAPDDFHDRIAFLASDELSGRNTPSPGLELAADYIAGEFADFGLSPAGDNGTFMQRWPYEQTAFDLSGTSLTLRAGSTTVNAVVRQNFFVLPAAGTESASGPISFAGVARVGRPPVSQDAAGTFAMLYMPGTEPDQEWQNTLTAAIGAAMPAGVKGIVFILDPGFESGMISQIADEVVSQQAPMYLIGLDYASAQRALAAGGVDLDALRAAGSTDVTSVADGSLEIAVSVSTSETTPPNVVGMLMGSDPTLRNEYVVFSAHMDHVGVGPPDAEGDSIYNGADDDASGTATMLEVAQAFASLPRRPARSLIFLAVSGEEKGLLGSAYFTEHPPVPIEQIVADINLDMVGRNAPDSVVAIGNEYSSMGDLVQEVAAEHPELGLTVAPDIWPDQQFFFRSDHFNFAKNGVPAIFFTTGEHDQYHKPSDEVELIDLDKITRIGRLVFYLAWEVATQPDAPTWTAKGIEEVKPARGGGG